MDEVLQNFVDFGLFKGIFVFVNTKVGIFYNNMEILKAVLFKSLKFTKFISMRVLQNFTVFGPLKGILVFINSKRGISMPISDCT